MDPRTYFWSLDRDAQAAYAQASGYKAEYLRYHLIRKRTRPDKEPTKTGIYALADASGGHVSRAEAVRFFFPSDELRFVPPKVEAHAPS